MKYTKHVFLNSARLLMLQAHSLDPTCPQLPWPWTRQLGTGCQVASVGTVVLPVVPCDIGTSEDLDGMRSRN